ncbi:hypothetical protein SDC9_110317 [bioreactor metagenome]|uniref:Uncharacterized protein n=1 Tax=bioreactor metagenome TaxID=1076179 RepID=A0A645BDM8_9ZZZZ
MEKLSINTLEGWNQQADIANKKAFMHTFGREPIDETELYQWVDAIAAEMIATAPKEPDTDWELVKIGEEVFLTRYF